LSVATKPQLLFIVYYSLLIDSEPLRYARPLAKGTGSRPSWFGSLSVFFALLLLLSSSPLFKGSTCVAGVGFLL